MSDNESLSDIIHDVEDLAKGKFGSGSPEVHASRATMHARTSQLLAGLANTRDFGFASEVCRVQSDVANE